MLPLLPALILLLLQGPSNFERLAVDARLPLALEAIHRQMAQPGAAQLSEQDEQALATLLAAGANAELTHALISFLWRGAEPVSDDAVSHAISSPPVACTCAGPPTPDGFARSQRTRDGPAILSV